MEKRECDVHNIPWTKWSRCSEKAKYFGLCFEDKKKKKKANKKKKKIRPRRRDEQIHQFFVIHVNNRMGVNDKNVS